MKEYIERAAVQKLVLATALVYGGEPNQYTLFLDKLDKIPAAVVVEVVRCRDCKHIVICNPRFTPKEVERAKAIRVLYPKVTGVALEGSRAVPGSGEVFFFAQEEQFPSLELNETVKLDDIIGGAE